MKYYILLVLGMHLTYLPTAQTPTGAPERFSRILVTNPDQQTIDHLLEAGIDLHCGSRSLEVAGEKALEIECSSTELNTLNLSQVQYSVLIDDVAEFYKERANANLGEARDNLERQKQQQLTRRTEIVNAYPTPSHFVLGEMAGFLYYDQILETLDAMAAEYPHLMTIKRPVSDSLTTIQGREVFWVKISDHPESDENEPEVLYTGVTHAREPASAMSMLYYMWFLLENYETHPEAKRIVDLTELYFIPVVNPDGYIHNQTIAPEGGGMWRKNMHDNDGNQIINDKDGVDLNRNYGFLWGHDNFGSSANPAISTYRGTGPFSEPETRMVRDFVLQRNFVTAMHDHTYGTDLYHSWEHGPHPLADADFFYRTSDLMAWDNRYLFGQSYNTYWLGEINGGANDWFYGEQIAKPKIMSWLAEIGPAFWPDPLDIVKICQDQMQPHFMVAQIAGQHVRMDDLNGPDITYGANTFSFRIENLGLQAGDVTVSINPLSANIMNSVVENDGVVSFDTMMQTQTVDVTLWIDTRAKDGETIAFEVVVKSDGYVIDQMHVTKSLDPVLVMDATDGMTPWTTEAWGIQPDPVDMHVEWITDSPGKNQLNDFTELTLKEGIDLSDIQWAKVVFKARWKVETAHDFVQVEARTADGEWQALSGRYTKQGAEANAIEIPSPLAGQPTGQPIYDGRQRDWVQEEIDLSAFVGNAEVQLRFVAWSGGTVSPIEEDGFYFRDLKIYASRKLHCLDHQQNADEESIDCGGIDCALCQTCSDGLLNGNEEAIDCGGADCIPCASCTDGILNSDEEGIDCGGTGCVPCATCNDGIQNGNETGIDCGGACNTCIPTCTDGILNGDEENVDCGGSCPDPCKTICCDKENKIWYGDLGYAIRLAPNPASDELTISLQSNDGNALPKSLTWEIRNMQGMEITHGYLANITEAKINVSELVPQLYVILLTDERTGFIAERFVKL